jgi:hypothetical protein
MVEAGNIFIRMDRTRTAPLACISLEVTLKAKNTAYRSRCDWNARIPLSKIVGTVKSKFSFLLSLKADRKTITDEVNTTPSKIRFPRIGYNPKISRRRSRKELMLKQLKLTVIVLSYLLTTATLIFLSAVFSKNG